MFPYLRTDSQTDGLTDSQTDTLIWGGLGNLRFLQVNFPLNYHSAEYNTLYAVWSKWG